MATLGFALCSDCSDIPNWLRAADSQSPALDYLLSPHSNVPPDSYRRSAIHDFLSHSEQQVAELNERISTFEEHLALLQRERDAISQQMRSVIHTLHPIRSLPADILIEIAGHCVPDWTRDGVQNMWRGHFPRPSSLNTRQAPWTLSQVCSRWRDVVLASSRLWSCIFITDTSYRLTRVGPEGLSHRMSLWIQRSGHCDLSVVVLPALSTVAYPFSSILLSTCSRWKHLFLSVPDALASMSDAAPDFRRLEGLVLRYNSTSSQQDLEAPLNLQMASNLRLLQLLEYPGLELDVKLDCAQVTQFASSQPFSPRTLNLLQSMHQLRVLAVSFKDDSDSHAAGHNIHLPNIEIISVSERSHTVSGTSKRFLELVEAPSIQELYLSYISKKARLPKTFRHLDNVKKLGIHNFFESRHHCSTIASFLRKIPRLSILNFNDQQCPSGFIDLFALRGSDEDICKGLMDIYLSKLIGNASDADKLLDMLESRCGRGPGGDMGRDYRCIATLGLAEEDLNFLGGMERWEAVRSRLSVYPTKYDPSEPFGPMFYS